MLSPVDFGSLPQKNEKISSCPETASKFMSTGILSNKMYVNITSISKIPTPCVPFHQWMYQTGP